MLTAKCHRCARVIPAEAEACWGCVADRVAQGLRILLSAAAVEHRARHAAPHVGCDMCEAIKGAEDALTVHRNALR